MWNVKCEVMNIVYCVSLHNTRVHVIEYNKRTIIVHDAEICPSNVNPYKRFYRETKLFIYSSVCVCAYEACEHCENHACT